ncbi:hypothetical protein HaLaN_07703 [Haematococcus lacustris]|uniref:Uncharacterized protein n=1 Tax=Haematococcus lacustris TaxID=44745 RepID=A0A699YS30_HAELA|nr:hypothetical protein HaLaN_07703 [Haematococcus lacustris]
MHPRLSRPAPVAAAALHLAQWRSALAACTTHAAPYCPLLDEVDSYPGHGVEGERGGRGRSGPGDHPYACHALAALAQVEWGAAATTLDTSKHARKEPCFSRPSKWRCLAASFFSSSTRFLSSTGASRCNSGRLRDECELATQAQSGSEAPDTTCQLRASADWPGHNGLVAMGAYFTSVSDSLQVLLGQVYVGRTVKALEAEAVCSRHSAQHTVPNKMKPRGCGTAGTRGTDYQG